MSQPEITIVETKPLHIRLMAEAMDAVTIDTARKIGSTPNKVLWHSYKRSVICKTAFIDGEIAAMWGVSGAIFSNTGEPWLVMAPWIEAHPFRVAFRYRKELNKFQQMFPILEEWVPENNKKSIRLLELMGFKIDRNPVPVGDAVFHRAERRLA